MLIQPEPDETLDSYFSRNLIFSGGGNTNSLYKKMGFAVSNGDWTLHKLRRLSNFLGWDGIPGFRRLLVGHTGYVPSMWIEYDEFKKSPEWLYRIRNYSKLNEYLRGPNNNLCPDCVREDLSKFGFAYWRRSHQFFDVKVCNTHNTKLVSACPICESPFSNEHLYIGVLWDRCNCGTSAHQYESEPNSDKFLQKYAKFVFDVYSSDFQFEWRSILNRYWLRLVEVGTELNTEDDIGRAVEFISRAMGQEASRYPYIELCLQQILNQHIGAGCFNLPVSHHIGFMVVLFSSYGEFLHSLDHDGLSNLGVVRSRLIDTRHPSFD
ncbi:TniQ family protein [Pseudomonas resinovorans]|uniref:TniQ family protein n=1 Tax=Metapseudomonas resinovorans TaxID=53412 RepID=UPI00237EFB7F|nr:TniQ family protein [Pseudomonas resinovorans]MDE3739410.1 TniQ family protein [Pseudomonas resinovorans]